MVTVNEGAQDGNRSAHQVLEAADELGSKAATLRAVVDNFTMGFRLGGSAIMQWGDVWLTGNSVIDADHKRLVELSNDLVKTVTESRSRDEVGKALSGLIAYTAEHFAREEEIWQKNGLPSFEEHKQIHAELVAKVLAYEADFKAGKSEIGDDLLSFVRSWLVDHVFQTDKVAVLKIRKAG
jgi:hemerythrin-like metal-binding protein